MALNEPVEHTVILWGPPRTWMALSVCEASVNLDRSQLVCRALSEPIACSQSVCGIVSYCVGLSVNLGGFQSVCGPFVSLWSLCERSRLSVGLWSPQ